VKERKERREKKKKLLAIEAIRVASTYIMISNEPRQIRRCECTHKESERETEDNKEM